MKQWENQVCVITGAASGIGAGLVRHAASLGMKVVAADIDMSGLAALKRDAEGEIDIVSTDVTLGSAMESLAEYSLGRHGEVNLLFNNAGVLVDGKSWERTEHDWQWNLNVNVMGVVNGIRAFVPRMLAQGSPGRVVNTSSIGGLLGGGQFMGPYQASKHAVSAITETLFQELALESAPVTASCLCPGEVDTQIWESDRLRDPRERNQLASEAEQQFHDQVAGMVAEGLTPKEFAHRVWEGIEADRFWIFPQKEFKAMFQVRVDSILKETQPAAIADLMR
ncbi:MAG: SDR family NAD(P)-dependent oxidoreductase [Myxococcota bacterium]|jgi:NAD(P)-dependent dehydrogenase (short-subunit alcohol dehydrogenase family)|nr:SDR family NAD(P)-dependent oxidoreductase [Myxococcota bacterium]